MLIDITAANPAKVGYADYKNITFENRAAGGDGASHDALAHEVLNLKPAVIGIPTVTTAL
jgi:hypothetical protein